MNWKATNEATKQVSPDNLTHDSLYRFNWRYVFSDTLTAILTTEDENVALEDATKTHRTGSYFSKADIVKVPSLSFFIQMSTKLCCFPQKVTYLNRPNDKIIRLSKFKSS